jgi:hypothetical protein
MPLYAARIPVAMFQPELFAVVDDGEMQTTLGTDDGPDVIRAAESQGILIFAAVLTHVYLLRKLSIKTIQIPLNPKRLPTFQPGTHRVHLGCCARPIFDRPPGVGRLEMLIPSLIPWHRTVGL